MYLLKVESNFCAAHKLIDYSGPCNRLHGHNWRVILNVKTEILNSVGIGIDFKDLKVILNDILDQLDHRMLNDIPPFDKINPTAENISAYVFDSVQNKLPESIFVDCVELYESDKYSVKYYKQ